MSAKAAGSDQDPAEIGWARAIVSGVGIVVVALVLTIGGANAIITHATGFSRHVREYLAAIEFLVVVVAMAWVVRRLQQRRLI